jgi:hypothetical protein
MPPAADRPEIELQHLDVLDSRFDLAKHFIAVGSIRLAGGSLRAWLAPDGTLNYSRWMRPAPGTERPAPERAPSPPPAAPSAGPAPPANGAAWSFSAPDIAVKGLRLTLEDRRLMPAPVVTLDGVELTLLGLRSPGDAPLRLAASAAINHSGRLEARATYTLATGAARADVRLSRVDLTALQPYLARETSLSLLSGRLSTHLTLERDADGLEAAGDADVTRVRTIDAALRQDFVRWERLSIEGLEYRSRPARLAIRRIVAHQPYARVIVSADRTLNVAAALSPPGGRAPAPAKGPSANAARAASAASGATPAQASAGGSASLPVAIGRIEVEDGSARYTDRWIEPHFTLAIEGLSGAVEGVSSDPRSRARIELDGKVDQYAPIHLAGETNLFAASVYTDMTMSFKGVELTTVTPYSARFAGYKIDKGKLSADITYRIENRALTANHRFVIDQLQLGERVESADAVKLPVRLAVALLKDRHGVIDLGLPVTGSLDDPQFRIGPLVWKAIVNELAKAATAPFALLGRVFGRGPEIKEIDFAPGQASLDAEAQDRLSVVAKALAAHPALELDVPSAFVPDLDRPALRIELVRRKLLARAREQSASRKRFNDTVDESILADPATHLALLAAEYRSQLGPSAPLPPDAQAALDAHSREPASPATRDEAIRALEAALAERTAVSDDNLQALGRRRARAIRDAVLGPGGVDPGRLFVLDAASVPARGGRVALDLGLK